MQIFKMLSDQKVSVSISPVDGSIPPQPSKATLSNVVFTSSDTSVFTVAPDPSDPNGAIVTGVAPGTANLNASATATEPNGNAHTVTDAAQITLSADVPPAAGFLFTFGSPTSIGVPPPPAGTSPNPPIA